MEFRRVLFRSVKRVHCECYSVRLVPLEGRPLGRPTSQVEAAAHCFVAHSTSELMAHLQSWREESPYAQDTDLRPTQGGEEVHCCNSFTLIAQKCHPPLSRLGTPRHFPHPAQHTAFRDVVTEHFQLTKNARCTQVEFSTMRQISSRNSLLTDL